MTTVQTGTARRGAGRARYRPLPLVVDIFAGAGGASCGIRAALGREIDHALNHDPQAVEVHTANHPGTEHHCADAVEAVPLEITGGRPVGLAWFSPDCTHHSRAKGGKPRDKNIRALAWVVVRWAREVRPRVIMLENVPEFEEWGPLREDGRPCRDRRGSTFRAWADALRELGYAVEWRVLCAADYGAPTIRRRLFLIARCDGEPVRWPDPTHAPRDRAGMLGLRPWVAAAECIDWSLPVHSIFLSPEEARAAGVRRPLAEATLRRIAVGLRRFVIEAGRPFIVQTGHQTGDGGKVRDPGDPLSTVVTKNEHCVVAPTLAQTGYGERDGQSPRAPDLDRPLGTIVGGGCKHALVAAFLAKHYGGVYGHGLDRPVGTVTATDHHGPVAAHLVKLRGMGGWKDPTLPLDTVCAQAPTFGVAASFLEQMHGTGRGVDMGGPCPTVTAGGNHLAAVSAFLVKYYGAATAQDLRDPLGTATARARFGLVLVDGVPHRIVDIGMRMLQPHELLRAQFGSHAEGYRLLGSKARQIHAIGNSVPPQVAEALVRANLGGWIGGGA